MSLLLSMAVVNALLAQGVHPRAAADGELRFNPAAPQARQSVSATYSPPRGLTGATRVSLRARLRTIHGNVYSEPPYATEGTDVITIARLTRGADGRLRGSFVFPDSVVYAVFAVENAEATFVDTNHDQYWELLAHDARGRPTFDALDQRTADLEGRNWVEAYATARRMVAVYPNRAGAWRRQWIFEALLTGADKRDSLIAAYRSRFVALARLLETDTAAARGELPEMAWYAFWLQYYAATPADSAMTQPWITRGLREAPTSPLVLDVRMSVPARGMRNNPLRSLAQYDSLWWEGGDSVYRSRAGFQPRHQMSRGAYRAALLAKDTAALQRWSERVAIGGRYARRRMARVIADQPSTRAVAADWIRDELRISNELRPEHRLLGETRIEQRKRQAQESRELLALLGKTLVAEGRLASGLDTLVHAAADGWNVAVFREIADARLAAGDTIGALEMHARVIADPRSASSYADSVARFATHSVDTTQWKGMLRRARAELPRRVLVKSIDVPIVMPVRLTDRAGRTQELATLRAGKPAFIFHWVRDCPDAMRELALADSVGATLALQGVRVFSVSSDAPSPAIDSLIRQKRLRIPVYYDLHKDLHRAVNSSAWPAYFVLDAAGHLRFRFGTAPDDALVQLLALQRPALQP